MEQKLQASQLSTLNLRSVPELLVRGLKSEAAIRGVGIRDFCVGLLAADLARLQREELGVRDGSSSDGSEAELGGVGGPGGDAFGGGGVAGSGVEVGGVVGAGSGVGEGGVGGLAPENNSGVSGSDAHGTSGVDLRGDEDLGPEVVHRAGEDVKAEGVSMLATPSSPGLSGTAAYAGKRSGPGEIMGCVHSVPTRGCPVCGGKFEMLAAIAAGDFVRTDVIGLQPEGKEITGETTKPTCVACEAPLQEGRGKLVGKFACVDQACGMHGQEQKGKR